MEIITRAQAKLYGLNRYYTGVPCKKGHVDYRYTQSGACKSCIGENNGRAVISSADDDPEVVEAKAALEAAKAAYSAAVMRAAERQRLVQQVVQVAKVEEMRANHERLLAAKKQLVGVKVRTYDDSRANVAAAAFALAVMRFPFLGPNDVDPHLAPKGQAGGTALHTFLCHPEDVDQLRAVANATLQRPNDIAQRRTQLIGQAVREHVEDTTPPMSFK